MPPHGLPKLEGTAHRDAGEEITEPISEAPRGADRLGTRGTYTPSM